MLERPTPMVKRSIRLEGFLFMVFILITALLGGLVCVGSNKSRTLSGKSVRISTEFLLQHAKLFLVVYL